MAAANTPNPTKVDEAVLAELREHEAWHGSYLLRGIERHHPETHPGVPLSLFEAYAERLGYDVEQSRDDVEAKVVEDTEWVDDDAYYRVGDNISAYPQSWHEAYEASGLHGLVLTMRTQMQRDVRRDEVLLAVESIVGMGRRGADALLTQARKAKEIALRPRTNPEAFVYPVKQS